MTVHALFTQDFLAVLKSQVDIHHSIYPHVPPQGIYFEALVENAFRQASIPFTRVQAGSANAPRHDLMVGQDKISLKTETGRGTKPDRINITKLCTTEREPWDAGTLVGHAMTHLSRYEHMLMLRAVWDEPLIHYQIVDIPIVLLRRIETAEIQPVGRRTGRKSLGGDVFDETGLAFHVHFDGSDGKCQVRALSIDRCNVLRAWDKQIG